MTANHPHRQASRRAPARREGGAVIVEFAMIALLMYMLIAVTIDFGRLFFTAQALQDAARTTAREISVIPLPPGYTLTDALNDPKVRSRVWQPEHLVIDLDNIPGGLTLDQFYATLPVLNQLIRPLMIFDTNAGTERLLRYPGTLLEDGSTPSGRTVGIPFVVSRGANGIETIRWVPIIEEIRDPNFPGESPFSMNTSVGNKRGLVAIRINLPYQAAMMTAHQPGATITAPNIKDVIRADDSAVTQLNAAPGAIFPDRGAAGPYAGPLGLGRLYAQNQAVRPFRKLLSVQAIFRREVFD